MIRTKTDLSALNERQKEAVISDESRLLVLAGAGSGKTQTLIQKLVYLIDDKGINSSNILAITFTKNAANEMIDRLIISAEESKDYEKIITDKNKTKADKDLIRNSYKKKNKWIENLTIKTFHSLCYGILRNYGANEFDNKFRIIGEDKKSEDDEFSKQTAPETIFEVFHKCLIELCDDNQFLLDLKKYILDYFIDKIHLENHQNSSLHIEGRFFTTLNGDKVRSKSEQYIADWLYRHSIPYQYEPPLNVKDFEFHPDFFIPDANLYIEHVSKKSYPIKDKEEQFNKGKLLLVKTYEPMTTDSALFNLTLDNIVKNRLPENFRKNQTLSFKEELNKYHEDVKKFLTLVIQITDLIKVENTDLKTVLEKSQQDQHERIRTFYKIAIPLIRKYIGYCTNKSYLDFNDLISKTISLLNNQVDIRHQLQKTFKYILVDEFQDVNNLQVELLKLLLTDGAQLFCVGDDWQSIYGFRGSNINYIVDFEKHFPESKTIVLNLNYRSTQNIVGASNEVIRHNKFKIEKELSALKVSENKIVVFAGTEEDENIDYCNEMVQELLNDGFKQEDILFLYRRTKMFEQYYKRFRSEGLKIQGKTIHAAKGLEAKVVFIIGLTEGSGGFPDVWLMDRIFQIVKKADYDLLMEEERRLFYVAITRAKDKLYLITEKGNGSSFLNEIPDSFKTKSLTETKSIMTKVELCKECSRQLENLWIVCPYCGTRIMQ
jgi:DNA helicase-4